MFLFFHIFLIFFTHHANLRILVLLENGMRQNTNDIIITIIIIIIFIPN